MVEYCLDDFRQCQDWNDRETRTFRSDEVDMTAIQIDVRRDNLQELDLGVTVIVGFSAPGM